MTAQLDTSADNRPQMGRGSAFCTSTRPHKWARDRTNTAKWIVRQQLNQLADDARERADRMSAVNEKGAKNLYKFANKLETPRYMRDVLSEIKIRPEIVQREDDFDPDPYVLNTPVGLVDLKSGRMRPPDPDALCMSATAAPPSEGTPELWREVLFDAVGRDPDLLDWLQRLYGYALTGLNVEKIVPVIYGPQDTSKTLVDNVTSRLAGDYSATIPPGQLFRQGGSRHLAGLKAFTSSRLATSSEIKPRSEWRSEAVKAISGGDPLRLRGMYQDFGPETKPICTMILYGNHLPSTNGADPALVRRIVPVPFRHQIPEPEQDPRLADKLIEEEGPAILGWMIEGAVEYFRRGLTPLPDALQKEKEEYAVGEDLISAFLSDRCTFGPEKEATTAELRSAWRYWCNERGHTEQAGLSAVGFGRMFKTEADARGLEYGYHVGPDNTRGYIGIEVIPDEGFEASGLRAVDGGA